MDRSVMNRATKASPEATPGYLYREIAVMTQISPMVCYEVEEYLIKKLQKDDPVVKVKVLRVIKHLCESGRLEFRRSMQRQSELIKACLSYRAPAHVLTGDAPARAVREEAEACVQALFGAENQGKLATTPELQGRIHGFAGGMDSASSGGGAGPYSSAGNGRWGGGGGGAGFGSGIEGRGMQGSGAHRGMPGSRMQGFGNTNFDDSSPSKGDQLAANIATAAAAATKYLPDSWVKSLNSMGVNLPAGSSRGTGGSYPRFPNSGYSESHFNGPPSLASSESRTGGYYRDPRAGSGDFSGGFAGGRMGSGGGHYSQQIPGGGGPRIDRGGRFAGGDGEVNVPFGTAGGIPASGNKAPQLSTDPGEYENRLVTDICAPGGARISPPAAALKEFCEKCHSLDVDLVCNLLLGRLLSLEEASDGQQELRPSWQVQMRVLYVIEAMLDSETATSHVVDGTRQFFLASSEDTLKDLRQNVPQCRVKATKIMEKVGLAPLSSSKRSPRVVQARERAPKNLLDSDRGESDEESGNQVSDVSADEDSEEDEADRDYIKSALLVGGDTSSEAGTATGRGGAVRSDETSLLKLEETTRPQTLSDSSGPDLLTEGGDGERIKPQLTDNSRATELSILEGRETSSSKTMRGGSPKDIFGSLQVKIPSTNASPLAAANFPARLEEVLTSPPPQGSPTTFAAPSNPRVPSQSAAQQPQYAALMGFQPCNPPTEGALQGFSIPPPRPAVPPPTNLGGAGQAGPVSSAFSFVNSTAASPAADGGSTADGVCASGGLESSLMARISGDPLGTNR